MNKKIAGKLYSALLRYGTPPDIAKTIAKSTEFLGESTEETTERDDYEAMIAAKALSGLIKRHGHKSIPNPDNIEHPDRVSEKEQSDPSVAVETSAADAEQSDVDRKNETVQLNKPEFYIEVKEDDEVTSPKKNGKFWTMLENMPQGARGAASNIIPVFMYIGMILLTALIVCLIASSLLTIIAMTVAGIALFIIGLLYGVSQLTVFPAAAYYEIGLGLILGGASILMIVLIYNVLTRLLPFLLKKGIKKLADIVKRFKSFRLEMREKAGEA